MKKIHDIDAKKIIAQSGMRASQHRIRIFEYLVSQRTHPTADEIYQSLSADLPTLSKTTVYNTLKSFTKKGLAAAVTIEDGEVRYDGDTSRHGHFKCIACGRIYDIPLPKLLAARLPGRDKKIHGHLVKTSHIYLHGVCKSCHG